jgi:hypothetical protein
MFATIPKSIVLQSPLTHAHPTDEDAPTAIFTVRFGIQGSYVVGKVFQSEIKMNYLYINIFLLCLLLYTPPYEDILNSIFRE